MKNITKTIITAVLLLIIVGLFAQDSTDDRAIVKDALGISTGLTRTQLNQFGKEYFNVLYEAGFTTKKGDEIPFEDMELNLKYRVNLNVLEELSKLSGGKSVDNFFQRVHGYGIRGISDVAIYIGRVDSFTDDEKFFYVNVEEIIKGKEYLKTKFGHLPQTIKIANHIGFDDMWGNYNKESIGARKIFLHQENLKIDIENEMYFPTVCCKPISDDKFIAKIRKIITLNDEENFYNRKYSIKGENK